MAQTTPNMGLTAWDLLGDPYDHSQLAANFTKLDTHNHDPASAGGVRIGTGGIADGAITTPKIADGAVTTAKLANGAVTSDKLDKTFIHPLGMVISWWRPNGLTAVPTGWAVPTGQSLTASQHDFPGGGTIVLPDLRNSFIMGVTEATIGSTGGSNSVDIAHTHSVGSHSHTIPAHSHTVPGHAHNVSSHSHGIPTQAGLGFYDSLGNPQVLLQRGFPRPEGAGPLRQFAYVPNLNAGNDVSETAAMVPHNHGGATDPASSTTDSTALTTNNNSAALSTDPATASTGAASISLSAVENRPAYVGLLFLMKVKY